MRLDLSQEALCDLDDILRYSVNQWGVDRAFEYQSEIDSRMNALADGTLSGLTAESIGVDLRRLVSGSHVIWFRVEGDALRIVRVLHSSRDAGRWV